MMRNDRNLEQMKRGLPLRARWIAAIVLSAGMAGCHQPTDTVLTDEAADLEVLPVVLPDPGVSVESVDTLALLPEDQIRFGGSLLITHVSADAGQGRVTGAYARVLFADSAVRFGGSVVGYRGLGLGTVRVNGDPMLEIPHKISVRRDSSIVRGVEYLEGMRTRYRPNSSFRFTAFPLLLGGIDETILTPDSLVVTAPTGGSLVRRTHDLQLQWRGGHGTLTIVMSTYDPVTKTSKPILQFRSRTNPGHARVPAKLLASLPASKMLAISFILANRREETVIARFTGRVLIQAASMHTSYVVLQ
jgi:hypothetical protein